MSDTNRVPPVALTLDVDQRASPFFRLPAELRIHIYELAVQDIELIWIKRKRNRVKRDSKGKEVWANDGRPQPPGVVMACKQLYQEVAPILYSSGEFVFHTITIARVWASSLGDENLRAVKKVRLEYGQYQWFYAALKEGEYEVQAELTRRAKAARKALKIGAAVTK